MHKLILLRLDLDTCLDIINGYFFTSSVFLFNCCCCVSYCIIISVQPINHLLPQTTYKSLIRDIKVIRIQLLVLLLLIDAWTSPLNNVTLCPLYICMTLLSLSAVGSELIWFFFGSELIDSAFRHFCKDALNLTKRFNKVCIDLVN